MAARRFLGHLHCRRYRMGHALRHARQEKTRVSITYEDDKLKRIEFSVTDASIEEEFTTRQKLVLIDFCLRYGHYRLGSCYPGLVHE